MSQPRITYHEHVLVLELVSPLHIGSGEPDGGSDAGVVRDFNGLPGLPGTSLQGILRAACKEALQAEPTERIFGQPGTSNTDTGRGGRLWVGWGVIHDSTNQPARKRLTAACRDANPVLRDAARPMLRDHVCLNERGVADTTTRGKFDELVVSAGHRFTVKLRFATATRGENAGAESDWDHLYGVLLDPGLCLGGKTRRGFGAFKVVGVPPAESSMLCDIYTGCISPESLWMFGGGSSDLADSAPVSGTRVEWDATGKGSVKPVWIIPGSSVKGALAHRTRFHANRIGKNFIGLAQQTDIEPWMKDLFGTIKGETGRPGKVLIDDLFIPKQNGQLAGVQNHVSINPFTGGAKDSALFNDQPLLASSWKITLRVQLRGELEAGNEKALEALKAAIEDLREGRLSLGAHAGRGYGIFKETPPKATDQP